MLLHTCCQLNLSGKLQPSVCIMQRVCACTVNMGHSGNITSADQLNGLSLVTLMLTRQLRLDAHSTWKCSLALLREEMCDSKQAEAEAELYRAWGKEQESDTQFSSEQEDSKGI